MRGEEDKHGKYERIDHRTAGAAADRLEADKPDPGGEAEKADHGPGVPEGAEKSLVHCRRIARN